MHGFALDAEGKKMSKSLGNVVTPEEVIAKVGVDVLRLYVLSSSAPWDDLKFNWEGVGTTNRAMNILWNVYRFPLPYMILDTFEPSNRNGVWDGAYIRAHLSHMPDEDRFIISRINSVAATVDTALKECQLHRATRELVNFILEDLSRWYIQLVRPRMWSEGESVDKRHAYETIYYVMRRSPGSLLRSAPISPRRSIRTSGAGMIPQAFTCWTGMPGTRHLLIHPLNMALISSECLTMHVQMPGRRASGNSAGRYQKWLWLRTQEPVKDAIERLNAVCMDRANAKAVRVVMGRWQRIGWHAEPIMKALGKGFGKNSFKVKGLIEAADGDVLKAEIDAGRTVQLNEGDAMFEIGASHVTFTEKLPAEVFSAPMQDAMVYVDVRLDDDLEREGYEREVIRRIQEMRKQLDLVVSEFISVEVLVNDMRVYKLLNNNSGHAIAGEVLAVVPGQRSPVCPAQTRRYTETA